MDLLDRHLAESGTTAVTLGILRHKRMGIGGFAADDDALMLYHRGAPRLTEVEP